jgi:uncharacterized tellurite resistance protein B-like protein
MFFIAGTDSETRTLDSGDFFCPTCDQEQTYKYEVVRQTATVFFIPILTLGELARYIECQWCGETFREEVLDYRPDVDPEIIEAEFRKAIKFAVVAISISDGEMVQPELEALSSIFSDLSCGPLTMKGLQKLVLQIKQGDQDFAEYLESVAPYLNDSGKELVIEALLHVAAADKNIHKKELEVIATASRALGISKSHLRGIIEEFNEADPPTKL